jgi:hypothetical protein
MDSQAPEGGGWNADAGLDGEDRQEVAGKARPDDPSGPAVAVDLRQNVAEDVRQGKDDDRRRQDEGTRLDQLDGNQVGDDQGGDEEGRDGRQPAGSPGYGFIHHSLTGKTGQIYF